jgi:hypothetical protein
MRDEQRRHLRIIHPYANPITCNPGLRDLEERAAYAIAISNADLVVCQTIHCQILAKAAVFQIIPLEKIFPISIGVKLIYHDCPVHSSVSREIPLTIPIDIELTHAYPAGDRGLPDGGADDSAFPLHVSWQAYVDGDQRTHVTIPPHTRLDSIV